MSLGPAYSQEGEVWKEIPGFPLYRVSNLGRLHCVGFRTIDKNGVVRERTPSLVLPEGRPHGKGYLVAHLRLRQNGKPDRYRKIAVHRIVAELFLDNPRRAGFVIHKDGDRTNNRADNLQWGTKRELLDHNQSLKREEKDDNTQRYDNLRDHSGNRGDVGGTEQPGCATRRRRRPYGRSWSAIYTCGWS